MWIFEQATGFVFHDGSKIGEGYSGHGPGIDNPTMENVSDVGPLPCGWYTIGPAYRDPEKGPLVMRLMPDGTNEMFGRGGFLIHGDSIAHPGCASEGCIIMNADLRGQIANSPDRRLQVVVRSQTPTAAV